MDFLSVEENLRNSFRVLAACRQSGEVREFPGVSIASAGASFQMFNAAFLCSPVEDLDDMSRRTRLAEVHFGARGLPWSYWICEDWLKASLRGRVRRLMGKHDLRFVTLLPGMTANGLKPPCRALPQLEIRRVATTADCLAFCDVGAVCFNVPLSWFREVFEPAAVWRKPLAGFIGFVDGQPVSTAATVTAGVIGVYNVATLPGHQRKGYGEAIMRYAIEQMRSESGVERSVLQATSQGLHLYERMGYRAVTAFGVYAS